MADYLPRSDQDIVNWTQTLAARVLGDPGGYATSMGDAVVYAAAQAQFAAVVETASQPITRTGPAIRAKETLRVDFVAATRRLVGQIRAQLRLQDDSAERLSLIGLRVDGRQHPRKSPLPLPEPPRVIVAMGTGCNVRLSILDRERPTSLAKPPRVRSAVLFYRVSDAKPAAVYGHAWRLAPGVSRTRVTLPMEMAGLRFGDRVWFMACWTDTRGRATALSEPVSVRWTWETSQVTGTLAA